jgi:hypothetical protein
VTVGRQVAGDRHASNAGSHPLSNSSNNATGVSDRPPQIPEDDDQIPLRDRDLDIL